MSLMSRSLAELIGTFWLVLGGCWLLTRRPTRGLAIGMAATAGLLVLVVACLAGCGGGGSGPDLSSPQKTSSPMTKLGAPKTPSAIASAVSAASRSPVAAPAATPPPPARAPAPACS